MTTNCWETVVARNVSLGRHIDERSGELRGFGGRDAFKECCANVGYATAGCSGGEANKKGGLQN